MRLFFLSTRPNEKQHQVALSKGGEGPLPAAAAASSIERRTQETQKVRHLSESASGHYKRQHGCFVRRMFPRAICNRIRPLFVFDIVGCTYILESSERRCSK